MSEVLVKILRTRVNSEATLLLWDRWRKMHSEGFRGSLTRDEFEILLDVIDAEREEAADEIERLEAEKHNILVRNLQHVAELSLLKAKAAEDEASHDH